MEADYREPKFLATFVDWVIGRVETLVAAALSSVTDSVQLVVLGSDSDLY